MLPLRIGPRFIARNTPARRRTLRTRRIARQNYAQCSEGRVEDGGILLKNRARTALVGRPYRRFSHGWGWDPWLRASVLDHSHTETNAGTLFSRQYPCC